MPQTRYCGRRAAFIESIEKFTMNPCKEKTPLLGKGGVDAPSRKMPRRHLIWRGRGGSFKGTIFFLTNTTPAAPSKVASQHFLGGAATPPQLRRGIRQLILFSQFNANSVATPGV